MDSSLPLLCLEVFNELASPLELIVSSIEFLSCCAIQAGDVSNEDLSLLRQF